MARAAQRHRATMRRSIGLLTLLAALAVSVLSEPRAASASEDAPWNALRRGAVVLFRHAIAPGVGDPSGMRLDDCATQRNLDAAGRRQAIGIGEAFRAKDIPVGAVLTSEWCRARDTAELAFPGRAAAEPIFNSFFGDRSTAAAQTDAARAVLLGWRGPGALVVSTHQVNITALTGIVPASGEGVVLEARDDTLTVIGRVRP